MLRAKHLPLSLFAFAISFAAPALADITAEDLWAEWQSQSLGFGQTLTASQVTPTANGLTLQGVTTNFAEDDVSVVGQIDQISMVENGDETVTITMSDTYTLTVSFVEHVGSPPVNIGATMRMEDLEITASGDAGARVYDYTASALILEDGPLSGGDGEPPVIDARFTMSDVTARYGLNGTDPENMAIDSSFSFEAMDGFMDVTPPPDVDGRLKASIAMGPSRGSTQGVLGNYMEVMQDPGNVPANFDLVTENTYERISFEIDFRDDDEAFEVFYANQGGNFGASLSPERLTYDVAANGAEMRASGGDLPMPVEASVGSAHLLLDMPLSPGAGPSPMAARLAYQDVTVGEPVWMMADPSGSIPRDPISVVVDISGAVQIFVDLLSMDPSQMDAPPGELRELTLNELRLSVGGAELTGTGDVDFAPGQMIPQPVGSVDLQLSGGNALLDRLQASGLVPVQQLAMVRGMLGAFARPGAMPDTMESTIEFTPGGGIVANGVPLQ